jgi:hypothetical protein
MRLIQIALAVPALCVAMLAASPAAAQKAKPKPAAAKAAAPKPAKFGALAVDRSKGFVFAWAYDHPTRQAASDFALEECRKREGNCAVVVEFAGEGCASYHTISAENGDAYGWGTGLTQALAETRSLQECNAYADGKATCGNHVWACNSKDVAPFKVLREDPVKPKPAKTDCLVQYEVSPLNGNDDWVDDYKSPVYRLGAKDCPLTTSSQFHSFHHVVWEGKAESRESNPEKKNPALQKKGFDMAAAFYDWIMARPSPTPGTHWRTAASVTASTVLDENVEYLGRTTGQSNSDQVHGICLAYAPPGITPVATYGAEHCRSWIR